VVSLHFVGVVGTILKSFRGSGEDDMVGTVETETEETITPDKPLKDFIALVRWRPEKADRG
jgi:hypothetical protein